MVSLSNKHCLLVSFLVVCFSFVNVASAAGNEMENPDDLTQSLHTLNDALVTFDQATLGAPKSINSLYEGLDIFVRSAEDVDMPREALVPVFNAAAASGQARNNFDRATNALYGWSVYGIRMYTHLEDNNSPDDVFYKVIQAVITEGHTDFNQSIEYIHTVIPQLQLLETNLNKINVQPKEYIKKDTDFVKMVSFVIQLAQEDSQVGRDLMAELQKIGPIPTSETEKLDPVQKSKIIEAYLNVFKKNVADSIESLSKLKVGQQSQLAAAPQAGKVSIGGEGNNGQEGDAARKMVFEAFKQLEEAMIVFTKHYPKDA